MKPPTPRTPSLAIAVGRSPSSTPRPDTGGALRSPRPTLACRWRLVLGTLAAALLVAALLWARLAGGPAPGTARGPAEHGAARHSCILLDHEHATWTALLQRFARGGVVDYPGLTGAGAELDAYLEMLQGVCRGNYDASTRDQQLAYWINAYNAYTVRLILEHYPLGSIREIGVLPGAAFRESFIPLAHLRGDGEVGLMSLGDIEHEILRGQFAEPRIHFAIVCASRGCPALRPEAYRGRHLNAQLDDAARRFVRDPGRNRIDLAGRHMQLSEIFKWFSSDFEKVAGSVPAFVGRYVDGRTWASVAFDDFRVEYLDYDWSLNEK